MSRKKHENENENEIDTDAETAETSETGKAKGARGGPAIVLPTGERRLDFIRRRYFNEGAKRGEIAKELGVSYQIVFAATKVKKAASAEAGEAEETEEVFE